MAVAGLVSISRKRATEACFAFWGDRLTPDYASAIESVVSHSTHFWMGIVKGRAACVLGLRAESLMADSAYLWLQHSDRLRESPLYVLRRSRAMIQELLERYPTIHGHTMAPGTRAEKWLRWLGAEIGDPIGPLYPFVLRKQNG